MQILYSKRFRKVLVNQSRVKSKSLFSISFLSFKSFVHPILFTFPIFNNNKKIETKEYYELAGLTIFSQKTANVSENETKDSFLFQTNSF